MGVRVRLSRNTSMYLPFWVAIPFWLIWVELLLCFWGAVLAVWLLWAMVALPVAGIAALTHNPESAHKALVSLNWKRSQHGR